jgi:hypothetical protein
VKVPVPDEAIMKIERPKGNGGWVAWLGKAAFQDEPWIFAQQPLFGRLGASSTRRSERGIVLMKFESEILMSQNVQREVGGTKLHNISDSGTIHQPERGILPV